jgi:anti-anti-sigma factor
MSTHINATLADGVATLHLEGRFDFNSQKDFRTAYAPFLEDATVRSIRIELSKVSYLDSSALGMLMLMRERAQAVGKSVELCKPNETVRKILVIANFGKLFKIE